MIIVAEGVHRYGSLSKGILSDGKAMRVSSDQSEHLITGCLQCPRCCETATTGGDKVLDDHHLGILIYGALDLILHPMILSLCADIGEGQMHAVGDKSCLRDTTRGDTGDSCDLREFLLDQIHQRISDLCTDLRRRERDSIIAVDGTMPARGPCVGMFRVK